MVYLLTDEQQNEQQKLIDKAELLEEMDEYKSGIQELRKKVKESMQHLRETIDDFQSICCHPDLTKMGDDYSQCKMCERIDEESVLMAEQSRCTP